MSSDASQTVLTGGDAPVLLAALASAAAEGAPHQRTLLVGSTRGEGRELLRALARLRGRWAGLVPTTPRPLAIEIAGAQLAAEGRRILDDFDEQALLDELLDRALEGGAPHLRELGEGVGFRRAARDAVSALRLAGTTPARVRRAPFGDAARGALIASLLEAYGRRLEAERLVDTAAVLERAVRLLDAGEPLPGDRVLLLPGLGTRGVAGRFLRALERRGARPVPHDPVRGLQPPPGILWEEAGTPTPLAHLHAPAGAGAPKLGFFRAAGITEELREVLRRGMSAGLRWDEIEIVTPDPGVYGPALHALASRLDVPVTFAVGLPVERTRPGRVVAAWFRWIQEEFPESVLRALLEAGDLAAPSPFRDVPASRLARRLRSLRVGWGRERYLPAIDARLERLADEGPRMRREDDPEETERRHDREVRELQALRALIAPLLAALPRIPGRHEDPPPPVRASELAVGLARFLDAISAGGSVDDTAKERLQRILGRVHATLTRPSSFAAAVTVLREHLQIRVPAPRAEGRAPWGSAGGHLHLTDVEHGGFSGRRRVFLVGLDQGRFPGAGGQDPMLLDAERGWVAPAELPGSADRLAERRFRMGALFARLRGEVTLSWAAWEPAEGRTLGPSPVLLQAYRLATGELDATFRDLERHVGDPVSRIPSGDARLDEEDVWLGALASDGRLLAGEAVVRAAHPTLDRGLLAREARLGAPGPHHGIVAPRDALDPRREPRPVLSASRLETLGRCGLKYFYFYVLDVRPPDDPTYDPERWLDNLRRGGLLHGVYDRLLRSVREEGVALGDPRVDELASLILEEEARRARREVPPPSEAVHDAEMSALRQEVGSFVGMLREDAPAWIETELRFGFAGSEHPAVEVTLPGGVRVLLRGAIDRVDRLPSGGLRVVDYKTGSARWYKDGGVFDGARRLQPVLYAAAAEALLGAPVDRMEYHFPTRKGENHRERYLRPQLAPGLELIARLLDLPASGRFLPTEKPDDCTICDAKHICRVREGRFAGRTSPLAEWAKAHLDAPEFEAVRAVRGLGEGS